MNELVITNYKNSIISAVYEDKVMIQVFADRKKQTVHVGNIYVGRIDNIVKRENKLRSEIAKIVREIEGNGTNELIILIKDASATLSKYIFKSQFIFNALAHKYGNE